MYFNVPLLKCSISVLLLLILQKLCRTCEITGKISCVKISLVVSLLKTPRYELFQWFVLQIFGLTPKICKKPFEIGYLNWFRGNLFRSDT